MTLYELLHQVSFDEIVPFIKRYHGWNALALYKIHYDYLRHLTPELGERTTAVVSNGELDESWPEPHLDAHPLEGDLWEHSLAKELIIEPDVKASLAEIAMCCLWHTSFWGFTEEQRDERFENLDYYAEDMLDHDITRIRAMKVIRAIESAGGKVPSIKEYLKVRAFYNRIRSKCKEFKSHRKAFAKAGIRRSSMRSYTRHIIRGEYYNRIQVASYVIMAILKSPMSQAEDLKSLLLCEHMQSYEYKTMAFDSQKRVAWMKELIEKYEAYNIPPLKNCVVCIGTSSAHPFRVEEASIIECIVSRCSGSNLFYIYTDEDLGWVFAKKKTSPPHCWQRGFVVTLDEITVVSTYSAPPWLTPPSFRGMLPPVISMVTEAVTSGLSFEVQVIFTVPFLIGVSTPLASMVASVVSSTLHITSVSVM